MNRHDQSARLRRILVVEESSHVLDRIREVFRGWNTPASIHYAFSLADAQRFLAKTTPDLVITSLVVKDDTIGTPAPEPGHECPMIVLLDPAQEPTARPESEPWLVDYLSKTNEALAGLPRLAERLLREWRHLQEKEQLQSAFDAIPDFVGTADRDGRMMHINSSGRTMMGIGENDDVAAMRLHDLFPNWSIDTLLSDQTPSAVPGRTSPNMTTRLSRQEGRDIRGAVLAHLSPAGEIQYFTVVAHKAAPGDTSRRDVQLSLRLETIGKLAAGIARDLNNALTPIIGQAEMALDETEGASRERLDEILLAAHRARELVRQIVSFGSPTDSTRRVASIESLVGEGVKVARTALPRSVSVEARLANDCGSVVADPPEIYQLVISLCLRAIEVSSSSTRLTVCLDRFLVDSGTAEGQPSLRPGLYAHLSIIGAPAEEGQTGDASVAESPPDRVLDDARKIVENHSGEMTARLLPDGGSAVSVFLPIIEGEDVPAGGAQPSKPDAGRVLLVDDDDMVTKTVEELLRRQGYKVTTRHSGTDALRTFCANPDRYDLVIADQSMPPMEDEPLSTRLRRVRPDITIILTTAHNHDLTLATMQNLGVRGFLRKPFDSRQLKETIRSALDKR